MKKKQSEKATDKYLVKAIKKIGGQCIKLVATHHAGLPDRLCLMPCGVSVFVEVKSEGDKPRKVQLLTHKKLRALGFNVIIIDTIEQADKLVNSLTKS